MGGIVAQKFALKYGHLLKAWSSRTRRPRDRPGRDGRCLPSRRRQQGYKKAVQDLSDIIQFRASPALLDWARREVVHTPEFVPGQRFARSSDADTRGSLSQIKVPTLAIAGEETVLRRRGSPEILAKGISDSTLASTAGEPSRKASIERDLRGAGRRR